MKCEEFEDRLNLVLDSRRRPEWDAELRLHGERCGGCRDLAISYGVLLDGFHALTAPAPPADLAIRVVDDLRSRPSTARRVSLATAVLATAAAALFVLPLWQFNRPGTKSAARSRPVALHSTRTLNPAAAGWTDIDSLPVVGPVLISMSDDNDATDPYEELAKGTGQGLASVVLYMPSIGSTPGMIAPGSVVRGESTWPLQINEGFKPVTDSVSETLDLLLKALPTSQSANRS
jgi:hypothetical protein